MKLLITGGAGYIGSHMVRMLAERKDMSVVVLDTLENGFKEALPQHITLVVGSTGDRKCLENVFAEHHIDAVMHFAAYISVEESVKNPIKYFHNNLIHPLALLETMEKYKTKYCIFSSTAAVYGFPQSVPIAENHRKLPESPYGLSKWSMEEILQIYDRRNVIRSITLRYFNASGASKDGLYGESHIPETHMVPLAVSVGLGYRPSFSLYGTDYNTRDGTCERDYIHVEDLCRAHMAALEALASGHKTDVYNVGTGQGYTNNEVIEEVRKQTGSDFPVNRQKRRFGDPSILVADPKKLMKDLSWKPEYSDLPSIISSAVKWHKTHPNGYKNKKT